ncbi:MAG TPA: type I DNA topoisomerase, partial [Dehalococcoidia bacterium]|nr:type I DNA topoisomerase [Dehalococcoidia bacterium]
RVAFHELTRDAIQEAFKNPRNIDMDLVYAQQTRRLLDRLVGYKLSPLLWKKVQRGLSAGRVQSAAVRIIVDREREIQSFIPQEYWNIEAKFTKNSQNKTDTSFKAQFVGLKNGTKIAISNETTAQTIKGKLEKASYKVLSVQSKDSPRQPAPPFITSTLQQEAWRKLSFSAKRTMAIAQQLYEGIQIGNEGSVGLITYMRTDSTHVASTAIAEAREYIDSKYGKPFLPPHARTFEKKRKFAQEAHEAIRPTKIYREPNQVKGYLKSDQYKLYELIWKRMVASQMAAAIFNTIAVEVIAQCATSSEEYLFKATSSVMKFSGFISVYIEGKDEENGEDKTIAFPVLKMNDSLKLIELTAEQNFTAPPARYTEATLVKALEQKGIGRPSTYAPIISTIEEREYVSKVKGRFVPNQIGFIVHDLLARNFPRIVDLDFTAKLEKDLDEIAKGSKDWQSTLKTFYTPFEKTLKAAADSVEKIVIIKEEEQCPLCGAPMQIKVGRFGKFLACTKYPECKGTKPFLSRTGIPCPECGKDNNGEIVERINKKRRKFYGCSRYPDCTFTTNRRPLPQPCPVCGKLLIVWGRATAKCTSCDFKGKIPETEESEKTEVTV